MMLVLFLLVPVSITALPMIDPMVIVVDDIQDMLFEVPEYEDPTLPEHQLSALGTMPIFTLLDKMLGNDKSSLNPGIKSFEAQKSIDEIIDNLRLIKAKLEKGSTNISADLQKIIQNLKGMEKSFKPNINQLLSSLKVSLSEIKPIALPNVEDLKTTKGPNMNERLSADLAPNNNSTFQNQGAISVKVISNGKPVVDKAAILKDQNSYILPSAKHEKQIKFDKYFEGKPDYKKHTEVTEGNIEVQTEKSEPFVNYKVQKKNMDDLSSLDYFDGSNNYIKK